VAVAEGVAAMSKVDKEFAAPEKVWGCRADRYKPATATLHGVVFRDRAKAEKRCKHLNERNRVTGMNWEVFYFYLE